MPHSRLPLIACLLALCTLTGCVERWLLIRSDPPGARVFLDGQALGVTPARVSFDHYGTREVYLRHEGYGSLAEDVHVHAPWYQWFPMDLLAEYLWPGTIVDERELDFALPPLDTEQIERNLEEVVARHSEEGEASEGNLSEDEATAGTTSETESPEASGDSSAGND